MANQLRQIRSAVQNPFPLPAEYLFPDAINAEAKKTYEAMTQDQKIINGGKLWSMYDLMKYYHSGFMPTNNDANYIEYEIDFMHDDIPGEIKEDPVMVNLVKTKMNEAFQPLSSMVTTQYAKNKTDMISEQSGILASSLSRRMGGGGEFDNNNNNNNNNNQFAQQQMPGNQGQQQQQQQPQQQQPSGNMFDGNPQSILSPEYLTDRCLSSIGGITFNSLNRIFVTRTFDSLPLVKQMDSVPLHLTGVQANNLFKLPKDESQAGGINYKKDIDYKEAYLRARTKRHRSRRARRERKESNI